MVEPEHWVRAAVVAARAQTMDTISVSIASGAVAVVGVSFALAYYKANVHLTNVASETFYRTACQIFDSLIGAYKSSRPGCGCDDGR